MDRNRPRWPANRNCHRLSRVLWVLAQIFWFNPRRCWHCACICPNHAATSGLHHQLTQASITTAWGCRFWYTTADDDDAAATVGTAVQQADTHVYTAPTSGDSLLVKSSTGPNSKRVRDKVRVRVTNKHKNRDKFLLWLRRTLVISTPDGIRPIANFRLVSLALQRLIKACTERRDWTEMNWHGLVLDELTNGRAVMHYSRHRLTATTPTSASTNDQRAPCLPTGQFVKN